MKLFIVDEIVTKDFNAAIIAITTTIAEEFSKQMERMKGILSSMYEEIKEYIETPDVPMYREDVPHYKARLNMPKRTYFPKIRATARSSC
ncbi:hypothetical protein [Paenibacillus pabuli]|uniref:hypothetical protein n=1 Tax=Paenibacillus pabuli TaxID=1472 RepID=UPI001FFECEC6|nr:hypothetical protein [Paenibacillus pabuli]UPK45873.1 hypothetical protein KET34_10650 [Paenibacillus pabuli]